MGSVVAAVEGVVGWSDEGSGMLPTPILLRLYIEDWRLYAANRTLARWRLGSLGGLHG